jgi:hypothetical protein
MAIKIGNIELANIGQIRKGTNIVSAVYVGETKVFPNIIGYPFTFGSEYETISLACANANNTQTLYSSSPVLSVGSVLSANSNLYPPFSVEIAPYLKSGNNVYELNFYGEIVSINSCAISYTPLSGKISSPCVAYSTLWLGSDGLLYVNQTGTLFTGTIYQYVQEENPGFYLYNVYSYGNGVLDNQSTIISVCTEF